jgi:large subunit ribosomal protein L17
MRHHKKNRTLGRVKKQRETLLRSLARSLVLHGRIETTEAKAKELRPFIERLITHGKKGTLEATRHIISELHSAQGTTKIMNAIAPQYKERNGGYTRIIKLPIRSSDAARMAVIEFV